MDGQANTPANTTWRIGVCNGDDAKLCHIVGHFEFVHACDEDEANKTLDHFMDLLRQQVKGVYHPDLRLEHETRLNAPFSSISRHS